MFWKYFPPGLSYFSRDWALSKVTLIEIQIYKIPCRLISLWLAGMIFHYVISSLPWSVLERPSNWTLTRFHGNFQKAWLNSFLFGKFNFIRQNVMGRSVANSLLLLLIWTAFVLTTLKMDPQFVSVYINRKICTKLENMRVIMNGNSSKPVLSLKIKIGLRSLRSGCALIHLPQSATHFYELSGWNFIVFSNVLPFSYKTWL